MTDIRQVLETAFDGEPPLQLDLAAVRRAGRRRVALRRAATSVAALAAVTAVCVPAMVGSSGTTGVAVGSATLSTDPRPPVDTPPRSTAPVAPPPDVLKPPKPPKVPTAQRAAELTALLASSGALPDVPAEGLPDNPAGAWEFFVSQGGYKAVTALTGDRKGQVVMALNAQAFTCSIGDRTHTSCTMRQVADRPVLEVDYQYLEGRARTVMVQASDETVFSVTAVNSDHMANTTGPEAPLTFAELAKVATVPGVTF
ncbi:hypothetical protein [Saccharothrix obliqua]|uniref:hypothetical protein n=1 Tax=Saccharothrix obliqua TaxID=2861747 RepID=UPI001C5E40DC|nr:hypothetical protein [Saccharothrix obliqua]MBW4715714.1 hypothetical protein [Saccharothrix obliqua]